MNVYGILILILGLACFFVYRAITRKMEDVRKKKAVYEKNAENYETIEVLSSVAADSTGTSFAMFNNDEYEAQKKRVIHCNNNRCSECRIYTYSGRYLKVYHPFWIKNRKGQYLPINYYPDSALQVLCESCYNKMIASRPPKEIVLDDQEPASFSDDMVKNLEILIKT